MSPGLVPAHLGEALHEAQMAILDYRNCAGRATVTPVTQPDSKTLESQTVGCVCLEATVLDIWQKKIETE